MLLTRRHPVEAPPERPRAVPARPLPPLPPEQPARAVAVLASLRAADRTLGMSRPSAPAAPRPIVLTDWSARLADDWRHHTAKVDNIAAANARESARTCDAYAYRLNALVTPLLSELAELTSVQLVNWRQALRVHAEAETALYGAKRPQLASGADLYTVAQLDGKACGRCGAAFVPDEPRPDFHAHVSTWNVYRHQACPKAVRETITESGSGR